MPTPRRLTAVLASGSLGWVLLALGVASPAAQADVQPPHDPATYYAGTEGLSGAALAAELNSIIDGHTTLTYGEVYDALPFTDEDPDNPDNLIVFYSGTSLDKDSRCGPGSCAGLWNREHSWPQSRGEIGESGPGADLFHMRPEFADTNSSRGSKDFDDGGSATVPSCAPCRATSTSFEPRAAVKGDLARGLFYMAVRYNGDPDDGFAGDLEIAATIPSSGPNLGKLSTLVAWALNDPPDARERARNDLIDSRYQHNRNPFIDHPEWVCSIWGGELGPGSVCSGTGGNTAPTTSPMTGSTAEDTGTTVALTATDAEGDPLTWSISQAPGHGTASVAGSTLSYTPAQDFNGEDVVGVTVSDDKGGSASTTVTITVTPVNDAPVALPRSVTADEDTAKQIGLPALDVDGDALTYAIGTGPQHGTVTLDGPLATYTASPNYHGPDAFTFTASDASATSAPATVSITVTSVEDVPVAAPVNVTTPEDTATTLTLSGSDGDGDPLTYALATQPAQGSVTLSGTQATYTPSPDFHGTDSFTWTVSDGKATATGTAIVTVTPVNDAPSVSATAPLRTTVGAPVSARLTTADPDGDPVTISAVTGAAHGSVSFSGTTLTYTPSGAGSDTLVVTVSDGQGGTATTQVGVDVAKATPRLRIVARGLEAGEPGVVKVKVRGVAGLAATGKVTLKLGSQKLRAKLVKGVATFRVGQLPDASKLKVKARYSGDSRYAATTAKRTYQLR